MKRKPDCRCTDTFPHRRIQVTGQCGLGSCRKEWKRRGGRAALQPPVFLPIPPPNCISLRTEPKCGVYRTVWVPGPLAAWPWPWLLWHLFSRTKHAHREANLWMFSSHLAWLQSTRERFNSNHPGEQALSEDTGFFSFLIKWIVFSCIPSTWGSDLCFDHKYEKWSLAQGPQVSPQHPQEDPLYARKIQSRSNYLGLTVSSTWSIRTVFTIPCS